MASFDRGQITSDGDGRQSLKRDGYWIATDLKLSPELEAYLRQFVASGVDLPPDPNCEEGYRFRRNGRFLLCPRNHLLVPLPPRLDCNVGDFVHLYFQEDWNLDYLGIVRKLPALTPGQRANPLLEQLIWFDFDQIPREDNDILEIPFLVCVHLLKHVAKPGLPGASSPDHMHQDGEPHTFAHLLARQNITGGVNTVASTHYANRPRADVPPEEVLAEFTLLNLLDTYAIADEKVSHYVSPIHVVPGYEQGSRVILLIDFTPLVPRKTPKTK